MIQKNGKLVRAAAAALLIGSLGVACRKPAPSGTAPAVGGAGAHPPASASQNDPAPAQADERRPSADLSKAPAGSRKACDELVERICADLGSKTESCQMVTSQSRQLPPERCSLLIDHYDEVLAELREMEDANKPLTAEQQSAISRGSAPSFGPEDAKVTIVEFSDFQCPYCMRASEVVHQIRDKYGDRVHFVFRQFPLSFHQNAHQAAEAALAAHAQGKFWAYHDELFHHQAALDRPSLESYAKEAGLDVATFKKALDEKTYAPAVDSDRKMGDSVLVQGTPTMFINGARVADPTNAVEVTNQIEQALRGATSG